MNTDWRHPTKWHVVAMGDTTTGYGVIAESLCDGSDIDVVMRVLSIGIDGWGGTHGVPPANAWRRRRLPIYGETPEETQHKELLEDDRLGAWLLRPGKVFRVDGEKPSETRAFVDDLLDTIDECMSVAYASVEDIDNLLGFGIVPMDLLHADVEERISYRQEEAAKFLEREEEEIENLQSTWGEIRFLWTGEAPKHVCQQVFTPLDPPAKSGVYVIQGIGEYVKIGKAKNIAARLKEIQVAHPVPLRLLAILSDDPATEGQYHLRFRPLRAHGEWFRFEGELREAVKAARVASRVRAA